MYEGINLAVIGSGRWGFNHIKTAYSLNRLKYVVDTDSSALKKLSENKIDVPFSSSLDEVLSNNTINSVVVATPAETHYNIALKALNAGKHVLVEKPITLLSKEAEELAGTAEKNNLVLMVGHVLLYHPAIVKIKNLVNEGHIGKLQNIYSNRLNLGSIRSEENILWSFAPHDISIIQYLTESDPVEIFAKGASFLQKNIEDTTITILKYPGNVFAHIFVSWLHPFKEHRLVVIGDKGMIVFEDNLEKDKLKFYKKGFNKTDEGFVKFESSFESLEFENKRPLEEEHKHFYECILNNSKPLTDGRHAIEVLKILEKAQENL